MEAVPKLPMISFELKVSPENTHFGPKLKQYIAEVYREDPESYSNELHQLEGLRSAAVRPTTDSAGLKALNRYFCQLRSLQSRFPMAKGQPAAVSFSWKDLYANMTCSPSDIRFELACILYNIGALHTQLGSSEPRNTADSLKAACTHYQNAAWAFQHLKEQYPQPPGVDISTEIMRFMQKICFAQAQECILEKSILDARKSSVVGAVGTQVLLFYKNSFAVLGPSTGTDNIHEIIGTKLYNHWHRYLCFKTFYISCIVCLYQGIHAEEQQKMGERVAFYQQAVDKLGEARKFAKYIEPTQLTLEALTFTNDVVEGKRKGAKNENEFIYHEEVPEKDLLMEMKPVCLVKALPINFNDPEISGPDILSRLVPICAHEASSLYSEEKAKILRQIASQVETKNTELSEFMSSLQLDQLEVVEAEQKNKIPQEIVDRCAAMNAKTEIIQTLVDSMNNLAEIISDVEHSLMECKSLIQEETMKEKEYQKSIGPRPPSIVQTELSREYHKYYEAHTRTNESNQVLHKAMTLHIANLRLLAQPLDVLATKIPSIDNIEGLDLSTMCEMRRVVRAARDMSSQRAALVGALRAALSDDDVTPALLARADPQETIFKQELEKHTSTIKIIEQNLAAQENIINKLTSLYASYADSRRLLTDVLRKREGLINALITSYDTYEELLGKSQKGLEFYSKLAASVAQLHARLRATCQVQREERAGLLAGSQRMSTASTPTPTPPLPAAVDSAAPTPVPTPGRKLKDYLPYMKSRQRASTPQAQIEALPPEMYYPESIYPTSVRPAPLGSEATDPQMQLPDGVVMPNVQSQMNPYDRYASPYMPPETEPYAAQNMYSYPATSKGFDKLEETHGYSTPYTPTQYSAHVSDQSQQIYSNPYYSATQNNSTLVTDSQSNMQFPSSVNPNNVNVNFGAPTTNQAALNPSQVNINPNQFTYDPNSQNNQANPIPDVTTSVYNQGELNVNFSKMQVSVPKTEGNSLGNDYAQTYFSVQYPQANTPNYATYSQPNSSNTNMVSSQVPSDYSSINYPYSSDAQFVQPTNINVNYSTPDPQYFSTSSFPNSSQGYTLYTNSESIETSTTTVNPVVTSAQPYSFIQETEQGYVNPALAALDAFDQPIKSHVTGEALKTALPFQPSYQSFDNNISHPQPVQSPQIHSSSDQSYQSNQFVQPESANPTYAQGYQNHPGYTFNTATGNYDYAYGSQKAFNYENQANVDPQLSAKGQNWQQPGVYTNAGTCDTLQSPSETPQLPTDGNNQTYYNMPYGYITNTNQANQNQVVPEPVSQPPPTNYGANVNQSTYMQSNQAHDTSVTYASNQVSTPKENIPQPNFDQSNDGNVSYNQPNVDQSYVITNQSVPPEQTQYVEPNPVPETQPVPQNIPSEPQKTEEPESKPEMSVFDLLSDIDFTVEHKPLMPEIKVPQISESAIIKPALHPKVEPTLVPKEEVIERPIKRDLFADPGLLNKFTQEVKNLQKLTDSFINKTSSGVTVLDAMWLKLQDVQNKQNTRRKSIAMQHSASNIVAEVVPYDDSRLVLKSDPDAYLNASYFKQLSPWCMPLVISNNPLEEEYRTFWKAVLENKINCIVCLLSEIEMQGKTYWPTAIGQALILDGVTVTLTEAKCAVHWTERRLAVTEGSNTVYITHYQISVFPAKIVCSPLVLLSDAVARCGRAWLHCGTGGGRSAVVALLIAAILECRAGYGQVTDMLEAGCINLYKQRTNVLEDTKFLADAYRTVLFYVQGVLCSGTTMFSGEAISAATGASVLPPTPVATTNTQTTNKQKFSRESFEEMKQSPGLKSGDMKDPLNFLDPLWSLKKK